MSIQDERDWRKLLWEELGGTYVAFQIPPQKLRALGIYGGQQGIWVDKQRTQPMTNDEHGIAVSILHKGDQYPDDFDATAVIYHYPNTNRPKLRDIGEIEAVKNCNRYSLPIFVIRVSPEAAHLRDVFIGNVVFWDDSSEVFIIEFGKLSQDTGKTLSQDAFQVREEPNITKYTTTGRPNQAAFRISVIRRYGTSCAVCGMKVVDLLDAAHLVPKKERGSDDPRNGIVLCCLHHRAFDRGLFAINPEGLKITPQPNGPSLEKLSIVYKDIKHLTNLPHQEALLLAWKLWKNQYGI